MLAAIEGAERLGLLNLGRIVLYNLNCVYSSQSRYPEALDALQRGWAMTPPLQPCPLRVMYRLRTVDAHNALGDLGAAWQAAQLAVAEAMAEDDPTIRIAAATCGLEPLGLLGEVALAQRLLASIGDDAARKLLVTSQEMWVAVAQFELKQGDAAAAERALSEVAATGDVIVTRVGMQLAQARAELVIACRDPAAALTLLPADETVGMNGEMRARGLALRVTAEAALGRLNESTVAAARAHFAALSDHQIATRELHTALAERPVPALQAARIRRSRITPPLSRPWRRPCASIRRSTRRSASPGAEALAREEAPPTIAPPPRAHFFAMFDARTGRESTVP